MSIHRLLAVAAALAISLSGCGRGSLNVLPPVTRAAASGSQANLSVVIRVPAGTAAAQRARRPAFISASTASVVLALNGTALGTINTTPGSAECTTNGTAPGLLCTRSFAIDAGKYSYSLSAFDQVNGAGAKLSTSIGQFVVVANQVNVLHAVLNGVVSALKVSLSSNTVQQGVPATVQVNVSALDADNNVIISGSYADANGNPLSITLGNSDTSGAIQLSQTTLTGAVSPVSLTYNGALIASQTVTATAPNLAGGGATLTVVTPSALPLGNVGALVLVSAPTASGSSRWQLSASVVGTDGAPMSGVPVAFSATGGAVDQSNVPSDSSGIAATTIAPTGGTSVAAVTATAGSQSAVINIIFSGTTTTAHRRGLRSITGPRIILGFSRPGGNGALSNPFSTPDACHVPPDTTPSTQCQPLFDQQKLTLAAIDGVQAGCSAYNTISEIYGIANCVGMTGVIASCVLSETGLGGVICAGAIDTGAADFVTKECLAYLAGQIADLFHAGFVYNTIQFIRHQSVDGLITVACGIPLDSLKPVLSQVSFTVTSPGAFSTDVAGYQAPLTASGAGFLGFKSLSLTRNGPSTAGPYVWNKSDGTMGVLVVTDTNLTLSPVVTRMGDPRGITTWTLTAVDANNVSRSSTFTVDYEPTATVAPGFPVNTNPGTVGSPGPTLSSSSVTLSWSASPGATLYSFGVRDMTTNALVVDKTTTGTSYTAVLSPGGRYRWNVQACNSAGCSSFTADLYFQTPSATVPAMPANTTPGTVSGPGPSQSGASVPLSWSAVAGATYYSFGVRDMVTNTLVVDNTTTATTYTASLNPGGQYRWNVQACNSAGCSSFTTPLYFQTPNGATVPGTPMGTSPGTVSGPGPIQSSTSVGLSWNASSGATYYSIGVRNMSTNALVVDTTTNGTSYTAALSGSGQYRWNVAACSSAGCSSFSTDLYFQTPGGGGVTIPGTPTNPSPGTASGPGPTQASSSVTLSWSGSSGATSYSLGVRDMGTNQLVVDTTTSSTNYTASLSASKQYRWNVAACDSAGCSSYTTDLYFQTPGGGVTIPGSPTNPSPGTTSGPGPTQASSSVTLSWSGSSGATSYSLGVRDMGTNQLVVDTTTSSTSYATSLSSGRQYRWNVAACNSAGCSSYTSDLYFQTPGSIPSTPSGTSPGSTSSPGPTQSSSTVGLGWNASSGATYYSLGVRDMGTNQLVVNTTTTNTSYSASLGTGGQYRWNVAACNSAGCSSYTTDLYFQTPGTIPNMPTGMTPGSASSPGPTQSSSTVGLGWGAVSGATYYSVAVRDMTANVLVVDTTTTSAGYTAFLSAHGKYRWDVAACNSLGCSSFTTPIYFQTP